MNVVGSLPSCLLHVSSTQKKLVNNSDPNTYSEFEVTLDNTQNLHSVVKIVPEEIFLPATGKIETLPYVSDVTLVFNEVEDLEETSVTHTVAFTIPENTPVTAVPQLVRTAIMTVYLGPNVQVSLTNDNTLQFYTVGSGGGPLKIYRNTNASAISITTGDIQGGTSNVSFALPTWNGFLAPFEISTLVTATQGFATMQMLSTGQIDWTFQNPTQNFQSSVTLDFTSAALMARKLGIVDYLLSNPQVGIWDSVNNLAIFFWGTDAAALAFTTTMPDNNWQIQFLPQTTGSATHGISPSIISATSSIITAVPASPSVVTSTSDLAGLPLSQLTNNKWNASTYDYSAVDPTDIVMFNMTNGFKGVKISLASPTALSQLSLHLSVPSFVAGLPPPYGTLQQRPSKVIVYGTTANGIDVISAASTTTLMSFASTQDLAMYFQSGGVVSTISPSWSTSVLDTHTVNGLVTEMGTAYSTININPAQTQYTEYSIVLLDNQFTATEKSTYATVTPTTNISQVRLDGSTTNSTVTILDNTQINFTDSGGLFGNYGANESYTITFDTRTTNTSNIIFNDFAFEGTRMDRMGIQFSNDGQNFSNAAETWLLQVTVETPPWNQDLVGTNANDSGGGWIIPRDVAEAQGVGMPVSQTISTNFRFIRFVFISDSATQDSGWDITIQNDSSTPYVDIVSLNEIRMYTTSTTTFSQSSAIWDYKQNTSSLPSIVGTSAVATTVRPANIDFVKLHSHEIAVNNYISHSGKIGDVFAVVPYTNLDQNNYVHKLLQDTQSGHVEYTNSRNLTRMLISVTDQNDRPVQLPLADDVHIFLRVYYLSR